MASHDWSPIPPHGGTLVDRVLRGPEREQALERLPGLRRVELAPTAVADLEMIGVGALSPLTGFMGEADYRRVVDELRLSSGLVWSLPITLAVSAEVARTIRPDEEIALVEPGGRALALMTVREQFTYDKRREAAQVYRTTDEAHPGVARVYAQGEVLLGGEVWVINKPSDQSFAEFRFTPAETRQLFRDRGWKRIVGFQTRNPIHRAHEYLQKAALETVDGLFLNPLVGETKGDDIPAEVRMRSYLRLLELYYPKDRVVLGVFPAAMRYAGPREAIFHAICRKNYGCTHFIVGRDHAGVGKYYGTYDAQRIFDEFKPEELGIIPLFFEHTFYCKACGSMASYKTCPHDDAQHLILSGTKVRELLRAGERPPVEYTRPEVADILIEAMRQDGRAAGQVPAGAPGRANG